MESQSADAEPPPPPKPELRYPGLSRADTEGETHTYTHAQTSKPIQLGDLTVAHQLHCLKKSCTFPGHDPTSSTCCLWFLGTQRAAC